MAKSKSAVSIALPPSRRASGARPVKTQATRQDSEWLLRAGALIACSTAESKGQSWLATRESSTSLVDARDGSDDEDGGYAHAEADVADDEFSPVSRRNSASRSGPVSRFASARSSRRGSRVGLGASTPLGARFGEEEERGEGYFVQGPDFVDAVDGEDEEVEREEVDERELQRLTREKGFALGGLLDRVIGWSMFRVGEEEGGEEGAVSDMPDLSDPN